VATLRAAAGPFSSFPHLLSVPRACPEGDREGGVPTGVTARSDPAGVTALTIFLVRSNERRRIANHRLPSLIPLTPR